MARITKITEDLNWQALKDNYFIGTRVVEELKRDSSGKIVMKNGEPVVQRIGRMVNELQQAIDDGTLDRLVLECAKEYHDGNIQPVLVAIARNLDSKRCNLKKATYAPNKAIDEVRLETLTKFVASRRTSSRAKTSGGLPQWAYGKAEINKLETPEAIQKVINSLSDVCCDKPGGNYALRLGENYVEIAKANREYARKRKAQLEAAANSVDDALLAKLAKGSKVTLTPEQAAQLVKILTK